MPKRHVKSKIFSGGPWKGHLFGTWEGEVEASE